MSKSTANSRRYGWQPDIPDHRDHLYAAPIVHIARLPAKADLRPQSVVVADSSAIQPRPTPLRVLSARLRSLGSCNWVGLNFEPS